MRGSAAIGAMVGIAALGAVMSMHSNSLLLQQASTQHHQMQEQGVYYVDSVPEWSGGGSGGWGQSQIVVYTHGGGGGGSPEPVHKYDVINSNGKVIGKAPETCVTYSFK